ncbi:MAG: hypothetical protein L6Q77_07845 [Bacteroidetes bacterium]|nr:hypothetical protein [Bacteroidota bacterium]
MLERFFLHAYKFPLLLIPYLLTFGVSEPVWVFFTSWFSSVLILILSISGLIVPHPPDRHWTQQIFRPVFLTQALFIGFTCISPLFYFADKLGFVFFDWNPENVSSAEGLFYLAECQRLYLLGQIGYTIGLLSFSDYSAKPVWKLQIRNQTVVLLNLGLMLMVVSTGLAFVPGLEQLAKKFLVLGYVSVIFCLGVAINEHNRRMVWFSSLIVIFALGYSLLTGSKEDSIIVMVILGLILFPVFRLKIVIPGLIVIYLWFAIMPVFSVVYRNYGWFGGYGKIDAALMTIEDISAMPKSDYQAKNWAFFTKRFSEVSMFEVFRRNTPEFVDFYGFEIINNSILALIPRFVWPDKPIAEMVAMERVWEAGIVERDTAVSAKTHYFVDSYLSFGATGVFFFLLLLGSLTAYASVFTERLFGGYYWGSAIMFTGLFRILWTGTSFEFVFNAILYSFLLAYGFHFAGRMVGYIVREDT